MKMIIDGQKVAALDGKVCEVFNPATSEKIDAVPSATREDIERALDSAQKGKKIWADTPQYERSRILMKFADSVEKHKEGLAITLCKDTGKSIRNAQNEIEGIPGIFRGYAERANHLYGLTMPNSSPGAEENIIFTRREPLGVIACIVPFNFPATLYAHKVAPALAMGNAVIIKPASDSPLVDICLTELLLESGIPGSVAQIITGSGAVAGNYLISSPKIDAICLTGSTPVGIDVAKAGAQHLHHVFLELGGNDALIIFEDAELELAVEEVLMARILNAGQICMTTKRILVQNSVKDSFTRLLLEKLKAVKMGDPLDPQTDMGCLIKEKAAIEVENQVNHTIKQGAKCIYGGKRLNKTFFEPTLLVDVSPEMDIAKDMEIFGPVFPIIGFDTMEEALMIANSSIYGLMGGVMTRDINKAMKAAVGMECGGVVINGSGRYRTSEMPFGGYKMSGMGREGVCTALEEMTQIKTIVMKGVLKK
jgi:acyl-CoA reductase-like NAD-dependent aldehyde dehydrogenase